MLRRQFRRATRGDEIDASPVLGTLLCGAPPDQGERTSGRALQLPLDVLEAERSFVDVWPATGPVSVERLGEVDIATDGRVSFGYVQSDERSAGGLRAAAFRAYASIFAALDRHACPHPLRFWNYVPDINQPLDGLERYRHFNIGRQEAFLAARRAAFAGAPAACAIGTEADTLTIYFLAARDAPIPIENPRQVSAYDYPAEHGPRAPTFSRATLATGASPTLFISGTASIVGHHSMHAGDPVAQTRETFVNLRTLVGAANATLPAPGFALEQLMYTVYVRNAADFGLVRGQFLTEVGAHSAAATSAAFLRADICRIELLVEIEATATAT